MPNRILRDWTDSKNIDKLTFEEEVIFTRLIMKADDFGKFHADPLIVRSLIFPRRESVKTPTIEKALLRLQSLSIIKLYSINGDKYLQINNFDQRLRLKHSKFPDPCQTNDGQVTDIRQSNDGLKRNETKGNEDESKEPLPPTPPIVHSERSIAVLKYLADNCPTICKMKSPLTHAEADRLLDEFDKDTIKEYLHRMENYVPLLSKSKSTNLTIRKWIADDRKRNITTKSQTPNLSGQL